MVDKEINIEKIDIHSLVPAEYNPRKISDEDYQNLKQSIDEFGVVSPILINLQDNTIISGHQRFDVLYYENNLSELYLIRLGDVGWVFPDLELEIKDKNYEKALNLAMNRIHGEFDENLVNEVLGDLEEVNLDYLTGFDLDLDDIDYNFISRIEDDYDEVEYDEDDYDEIIEEENDDEYVEEDIGFSNTKSSNNETKSKERIRRGFVKYGDIYKIGQSSYLMFGKDTNEQDRTKLFNSNIQKQIPKIPQNIKKIKSITQEVNYYMCNDAETVENIIINNKSISKKII